jgi:hypothetical protein
LTLAPVKRGIFIFEISSVLSVLAPRSSKRLPAGHPMAPRSAAVSHRSRTGSLPSWTGVAHAEPQGFGRSGFWQTLPTGTGVARAKPQGLGSSGFWQRFVFRGWSRVRLWHRSVVSGWSQTGTFFPEGLRATPPAPRDRGPT